MLCVLRLGELLRLSCGVGLCGLELLLESRCGINLFIFLLQQPRTMRDELLYNVLSRRLLVSTVGLQILYGLIPLRDRTGLLPC